MADVTYTNIDRPYDAVLGRTLVSNQAFLPQNYLPQTYGSNYSSYQDATTPTPMSSSDQGMSSSTYNENVGQDVLKTGQSFRDVVIDTWIKSRNYQPHTEGFMIDGQTGRIDATDVFLTGSINALNGRLGSSTSYWLIGPNGIIGVNGGVIETSQFGARVQIGGSSSVGGQGNDIFMFDDTTGGTIASPGVTGDIATIYFPRTDDNDPNNEILSQFPRLLIEKRKGARSNITNVGEIFFDQFVPGPPFQPLSINTPAETPGNYLFLGKQGHSNSIFTNVTQIAAHDLIQVSLHQESDTPVAQWAYVPGVILPDGTIGNYYIDINMKGNFLFLNDTIGVVTDMTAPLINPGGVLQQTSGSFWAPGRLYSGGSMFTNVADPDVPSAGRRVASGGGTGGSSPITTSSNGLPAHTHTVNMNTVTLYIDGV